MRKVISCKVIRTNPLNNTDALRYSSRTRGKSDNNKAARASKANYGFSENFEHLQASDKPKTVIYTNRLKISRIPIDNGLTSTINCYA
jgi:hypothetical protein